VVGVLNAVSAMETQIYGTILKGAEGGTAEVQANLSIVLNIIVVIFMASSCGYRYVALHGLRFDSGSNGSLRNPKMGHGNSSIN
jgi:hypothetical protein